MDIKEAYWNHFINSDYPKPYGCTMKRLEKVKDAIMQDTFFWQDILQRHGCIRYENPEDYKKSVREEIQEHCAGNFYGMIYQTMISLGIIKTR